MAKFDRDAMTRIAKEAGLEPAALAAVAEVESARGGFLEPTAKKPRRIAPSGLDVTGRPKILFEPQVFWKELQKRNYNPNGLLSRADVREVHGDISDILYPRARMRPYGSEEAQWDRLTRACGINEEAALCSASWGYGQVMGYWYRNLGWPDIFSFVDDMYAGYEGQTQAVIGYIQNNNLTNVLNNHDWTAFAKAYNGPGYAANQYDTKMAEAYARLKAQGW